LLYYCGGVASMKGGYDFRWFIVIVSWCHTFRSSYGDSVFANI